KGMLLKPEGLQGLPYLGLDWKLYEELYRPKTTATAKARARLLELTRLINFASDAEFNRSIGRLMDVDEFLRYLAACSAMVNQDSFIGTGHNYYLYLNPKDNRFSWIPWDLNHAFGGFSMFGGLDLQMEWNIKKPWIGSNRLAERVLAVEAHAAAYLQHLRGLTAKAFRPVELVAEIDGMEKAVQRLLDREAKAPKDAKDSGLGWIEVMLGKPADPRKFATRRAESVVAQLDGKAKGKELGGGFVFWMMLGGLGNQLAKPIMEVADTDKDSKLSRAEAVAALKRLFAECDVKKQGSLDEKALAEGLTRLLPKPKSPW